MQNVAYNLVDILSGSVRDFVPGDLIEFYAPDETELVPGNAVKRFANTKLVWYGWQYEQQAISRGSTNRYIDERFNTVNLTFSNIDREVGRWLSSTVIAGYRVLIRAVSRSVADESIVLFIGRCEKPFSVTNSTISLTIKQDLGSINSELPARKFTHACPLKFKGTECQGGQNPGQKSAAYNNAGTCDKSWQQCTSYANTDFFQGFRNTNVTGSFVLRERGMIGTTKSTKQWSSQDMTAINEPVPMGLGRTQIELTPVASADTGQFLYGHWVAGEGPIRKFLNTRNVTPGFKRRFEGQNEDGTPTGTGSYREHLGNYGNVAGQRSVSDFLGFAAYSRRAFIEGTIEGQNPDTGDPAPTIVSTVLWNPIPTPTADLKYGATEWTDNPVHQVRYLLTDERTLNYPANLIDDETAIQTAQYCDEPLYDKSGGEDLVVAQNSDTTDASFLNGRFRSTGLIDPFYWRRRRVSTEPESAERRPNITYFPTENIASYDEFGQPIYQQIPPPANLVPNEYFRKRYTANWHLKKTIKVADFLFRQLLPSFKGYLVTGADGRLQIRSERAAVQSRSTGAVTTSMNTIDVLDGVQFKDLNLPVRYVLIRNPESRITRATIRRVVGVDYLTPASGITIGAPSSGASTMNCTINGRIEIKPESATTTTSFSINSTNTAAFAYITVTDGLPQTATAGVRIDGVDVGAGGPVGTTAAYASQNWSPEIAAMIATNLNANPNLKNVNGVALRDYIEAVWDPANPLMVLFRSKQATLILDRPFTVNHPAGDLVTHFHLAFSDGSDGLTPNILKDSFEWPLGNRQSAYNQFSLTYQDAVQDGQSIALIENDYEHQESTNQINKLEVPGGDCVDNYHQADRLLLSARYKYRESDFFVQFQTAGIGMLLEEGDLILVNHSSMPSYQNYLYRIEELSVSQDHRVSIIARLYSDVQYPEQPVAKTVPLIRSNAWQTTTLPAINNLVVTRLPNAGNTARIQFRFPSAIDEPYVRVFARRRDPVTGEFIDAALVDTGLILYPDASNNGAVEIPGLVTGSIVELVPFTSTGLRGQSVTAAIPRLTTDTIALTRIENIDTDRLIGRDTAGTGSPEVITLSQALDFVGSAAQGDILYRGASSWTRLGAGTRGRYLQTGGASANPSWASAMPFKNLVYNGDIQIAQRGTSQAGITAAGYYTADRWRVDYSNCGTWTQDIAADAPTGTIFRNSLRMAITTTRTPTVFDICRIDQRFEGQNLLGLQKGTADARTLTLSFWVKSNVTGTYIAELMDNNNSRQVSASYTISSANTWEFKTITFPADTTGVLTNNNNYSLCVGFWLAAGPNYRGGGSLQTTWGNTVTRRAIDQTNLSATTGGTWQITGVQLEYGSIATEFEFLPYDLQEERCSRYLPRGIVGRNEHFFGGGNVFVPTTAVILVPYSIRARVRPTGLIWTPADFDIYDLSGGLINPSTVTDSASESHGLLSSVLRVRSLVGGVNRTFAAGAVCFLVAKDGAERRILFTGCEL